MIRNKDIAILFDLDGTMVDNKFYHKKAWVEFCKRHGVEMTMEKFEKKGFGGSNKDYLSAFLNIDVTDEDDFRLGEEKEQLYRELYKPHIEPINGLVSFIELLYRNDIDMAIATMAPLSNVEFIISKLNIEKYFKVIVDYYQVKNGKPDPEIFLKTAQKLSISPQNCVVIEDSSFGITAAKKAGMKIIGIRTYHTSEEMKDADLTIKDYSELNIETIKNLF